MDTLILIVIIAVIGGALLRKYRPDTYNNLKDRVLSLVKRK